MGRLSPIRSVLIGIPVYYFSLYQAPSAICKCLEKFTREFLREGVDEGKGSHLVSWEVVGTLLGRRERMFAFGIQILWNGFQFFCKSFFRLLLDPSLLGCLCLILFGGLRSLRKLGSLLGKYCLFV